jgi:hypothetical protein
MRVDHLVPDEVRALVERIISRRACCVLINDIWGATTMGGTGQCESSLDIGLRTCSPSTARSPSRCRC